MPRKYNHILLTVSISSLMTMVILAAYHYLIPMNNVGEEIRQHAVAMAENEIVLSDRFINAMRSSSPTDFIHAAEMSRGAVVFIKSDVPAQTNALYAESSTGSGVIISQDGYIVTNHHVINGGKKIEVLLNDNRIYIARVVGTDQTTDIALLKVEAQDLSYLFFGNSDSLRIGEWVMAIGNPFRLQSTVTAGVVSAKARNISLLDNHGIESFIQTDAAMNPGSSGGALINTRGDLVGIATAVLSNSGRYEGFSFAIPSSLVQKVVADLKTYGVVQRGWLGIDIENVDQTLAQQVKLDAVRGVFIASVHKGGGADQAGLKVNDVILTVNQFETFSVSAFMEMLARYRPGDIVDIALIRDGRKQSIKATLKNQINTNDIIQAPDDPVLNDCGIEIRDLDRGERNKVLEGGVVITSVKRGSPVGNTRMEPYYVVLSINDVDINSSSQFISQLKKLRGKSIIVQGEYLNYPGKYPYSFIVPN